MDCCRKCGKPIVWRKVRSKWVPFDDYDNAGKTSKLSHFYKCSTKDFYEDTLNEVNRDKDEGIQIGENEYI